MEALTALSKYNGTYDNWCQIRKRYSLKWANGNEAIQSLQRFFNDDNSLENMLQRIANMIKKTPTWMVILSSLTYLLDCVLLKLLNPLD